jgi:DNA replicative helicase MCM subunit Mcm2 (Cdc46/Mcm family)
MRIAEAFSKMRLGDYVSASDIDRAIAVTVDSFVGSQKVSCKKALARAFAKYDPFFSLTCCSKGVLTWSVQVYA